MLSINRSLLLARSVEVSLVLAAGRIWDSISPLPRRLSSVFSEPKRACAAVALVLLTVGPTALYIHEHHALEEKDSAYRYLNVQVNAENYSLKDTVKKLLDEQVRLYDLLVDAGYEIHNGGEVRLKVIATGYSSSPFETDDTPFITAANTQTRPGVLALSRDLLRPYTPDAPFSFGDKVMLEGLGEFIIEDSMNRRWRRHVDIWFPSRREALVFGRREITLTKPAGTHPLLGMTSIRDAD